MPTQALTWSQIGATAFTVGTVLAELAFAIAYLSGVRRLARDGKAWPRVRSVCAGLGLFVTVFAVNSVVGVYDMSLFWDHMVQHLALVMVAAPLLAFGAPLQLLREASGGWLSSGIEGFAASRPGRVLGHPATSFIAYGITIPVYHLTGLFNGCLTSMAQHRVEQVAFLFVGYLFWRQVAGIEPTKPLTPPMRFVYVLLAVPVDSFTGLALTMEKRNPFPAYGAMHMPWMPRIIDDIHLGGGIMWIGGDLLMMAVLIPVAVLWLRFDAVRTAELDARLDAERAAEQS